MTDQVTDGGRAAAEKDATAVRAEMEKAREVARAKRRAAAEAADAKAMLKAAADAEEALLKAVADIHYDEETVVRLPNGMIECEITDPVRGKRATCLSGTAPDRTNRLFYDRVVKEAKDAKRDIPPKPVPFADAMAAALADIDQRHAVLLDRANRGATQLERETWADKAAAASAYLSGKATDIQTLMIDTEASATGIDPSDLARAVVRKSEARLIKMGEAAAVRAKDRAAVKACKTANDVAEVTAKLTASAP